MKHALPALFALATMALPTSVFGQDTEWNRYTLEELGGVYIRAEATDACQSAGVSAESVRSETESALTEAAVPVLTESEMLETPGLPELRVNLDCVEDGGAFGFAVTLRVQQAAQMIRDTQITLPEAVTWFADRVGVASAGDADSAVQAALDATLEEFTAAFAAANPAEEETAN